VKLRVVVRLRLGIMDVQGTAVRRALGGLGFTEVADVRIGKIIELDVDVPSVEAGRRRVTEMCQKLLANPLLEEFTIEDTAEVAAPGGGR
jgi:phosphoribosylformylglycinamidine synthase